MDQELRFVSTPDGVRICTSTLGAGSTLVKAPNWLSHAGLDIGSPVFQHWWQALSSNRRFVRFDQRGCGLSDWIVPEVSFASWVSDLECVVDSLHVDQFDLFGMSQGAAVAIEYAARHPARVRRLVLHGGFARGWAKRGEEAEQRAILELIKRGWGGDNPAYRQLFTSQFMPDATLAQMNSFNELQRLSSSPENAMQFQIEVGSIDVTERLHRVQAPTLVFHSRGDARVPFEQGREIAASIPNARLVALESRNHILLESDEAWAAFRQNLDAFLGDGSGAEGWPVRAPQAVAEEHAHLTPREVEVLRLVAMGRSDREIASELYISPRTVGNHVKHILAKTECANRTAAAMYASTHGLL
jgi:pimeloyl-ACP methyl ester carboxylesterase/DNA-binding CsgD family transcriptional regulator